MLSSDAIERALEALKFRVEADPVLGAELREAEGEFYPVPTQAGGPAPTPEAQRRFLEWFLLERPSLALGAVPVVALDDELEGPDVAVALRDSLVGVYEISSLAPGDGLWLHDLLHGGEHPVVEERAVLELTPGDLLVGRLYPVGGGVSILSPAVTCFRHRTLAVALRADLERIRQNRRHVLRVGQAELELLFHVPGGATSPSTDAARQTATDGLIALGLDPADVHELLTKVRRAATGGKPGEITEWLNLLAFETEVDLESARRFLVTLLAEEQRRTHPPTADVANEVSAGDASAALAAFDSRRAAGADLEQLFGKLERDLGLEPEDTGEDGEGVPDFPGVVGAMVEEYLWDHARQHGQAEADSRSGLRRLGAYAADIGVFEEFGLAHLVDFSGRWLLDDSGIENPGEIDQLFRALQGFCRWSEESHAHALWTPFEKAWTELQVSVPRLLELRRELVPSEKGRGPYEVLRVEQQRLLVAGEGGRQCEVELTPKQASHLREGDLVRLAGEADSLRLACGYPKVIASVLG